MSAIKLGLVGHPLGHSISPYIHQRIMEASGISGSYELYDVDPKDMDRYAPILIRDLTGFNCTIPHKEHVIKYLDLLDPLAERLKAVNTVYQRRGFNTDREGFLACGVELDQKKVLILGAGGAARVLAYEAADQKAFISILAIYREQAEKLAREIADSAREVNVFSSGEEIKNMHFDVIMNATPLGMWPNCGAIPTCVADIRSGMRIFDVVYNPPATRLVLAARKAGAEASGGLPMLFYQALAAQRIWNPDIEFSTERLLPILQDLPREILKKSPIKIVLSGFMGAGKTTVGKLIAKSMEMNFIDLDDEIERACGHKIPEIFKQDGEAAFRKMESDLLREFLNRGGSSVIASGGGAIIQEENRLLIEEKGALTVYLHAPLELLWSRIAKEQHRPLAGDASESESERFTKVARLYEVRLPKYEEYCDVKIAADQEPEHVARDTISALGYGG